MTIDEVNTNRFVIAFELFRNGQILTFDSVDYLLSGEDALSISVQSSWGTENISNDRALVDMKRAKGSFDYLVENSKAFATIVSGRDLRFSLIDDCGTGTVECGRFVNDKIIWNPGHPLFAPRQLIDDIKI